MVWYGMVWYGVVWYGMWYGMVWYGMVSDPVSWVGWGGGGVVGWVGLGWVGLGWVDIRGTEVLYILQQLLEGDISAPRPLRALKLRVLGPQLPGDHFYSQTALFPRR